MIWMLWLAGLSVQPRADTAAFTYTDKARGTTINQHGDTLWTTGGASQVWMVDDGRTIHTRISAAGVAGDVVTFRIEGERAYGPNGRSVPVADLRTLHALVDAAKRGVAIIGK